jgi:hypothetical protein
MKLEKQTNGKNQLQTIVVNYNANIEEQQKIKDLALKEKGLIDDKNVIFVMHYGTGIPKTWEKECL